VSIANRAGFALSLTFLGFASAVVSAATFVDDFATPGDAWRFGNAVLRSGRGGLALGPRHSEATLVGTTVSPENLRTFTCTLQWRFGRAGQPVLLVGWGKAREWNRFDECSAHVFVGRDGRATVMAGKQRIGAAQLPAPVDQVYTLTLIQQAQRVVLRSEQGDVVCALPAGQESRPGYLALRVQGLAAREEPLRIERIAIEHSGQSAPLTPGERNREIQAWAKEHLEANWAILAAFKRHLQAETDAGHWGYSTDLAVQPGLVNCGEPVTLTFRVRGPIPNPCIARLEPDFLSATPPSPEPVVLHWQPDGRGGQTARVELKPRRAGNWRVAWQAGQERLSRVLAVVEPGYTVCRMLITSHKGPWKPGHEPEAYNVIHDYGLTADFWDGAEWVSPFSRTPEGLVTHFGVLARMAHGWGDHVFPLCNANWLIPGCPDTNLWRLDDSLQREGIRQVADLWEALGLGPLDILGSYTFGHSTPRIARELGVKMLDSLVQWQNWRDGGDDNAWLINQWGAPTVPYYVADDDFRKVAPGRSIVAFTQATTSSVRMYYINTLEGQPQLSFLRRRSGDMGETANVHRFQAAVDLWLAEAVHQREPLFVSVGLENFVDSPDWNEANKLGVHYLREQARRHKLAFTSAADIADYFHRHYASQPENWLVWPDVYAGLSAGYKPRQVADRIELSNSRFHSLHEAPAALPRCLWDFTRPWSEPVWDDQAAIRKKFGLVNPQLLSAENCVPRMVSLEGVRADVQLQAQAGGVRIVVRLDAPRPIASLPVAVWRVPLDPVGLKATAATPAARCIPMVDGSTGNAHAVVVCDGVPRGVSTWTVELQGRARKPLCPDVEIGGQVRGRMFLRHGVPCVYLWLAEPGTPSGLLKIQLPAGRKATVRDNDGRTRDAADGQLTVTLDRAWQHESPLVTGLSAAEIAARARFETGP
jgi:hypothetical protein